MSIPGFSIFRSNTGSLADEEIHKGFAGSLDLYLFSKLLNDYNKFYSPLFQVAVVCMLNQF